MGDVRTGNYGVARETEYIGEDRESGRKRETVVPKFEIECHFGEDFRNDDRGKQGNVIHISSGSSGEKKT